MTKPPHPLDEYAKHVQEALAKEPKLAHPNYMWCLIQVERHMSYVEAGGAVTKEQKKEKLVLVIKPLARKKGP